MNHKFMGRRIVTIVFQIILRCKLLQGEEGECESVGGEESEGGSACESSLGRTEGGSPVSSSSLGSQSLELPVVPPASQPEAELQVNPNWQTVGKICW